MDLDTECTLIIWARVRSKLGAKMLDFVNLINQMRMVLHSNSAGSAH